MKNWVQKKRRGWGMEPEPKVVAITGNTKIYWCPSRDCQLAERVCKEVYFKKSSRDCRFCLGIGEGKTWPEPWASIERGKKK